MDSGVHEAQLCLHLLNLLEAVTLEFVVLVDSLGKLLLEGLALSDLLLKVINLECSE